MRAWKKSTHQSQHRSPAWWVPNLTTSSKFSHFKQKNVSCPHGCKANLPNVTHLKSTWCWLPESADSNASAQPDQSHSTAVWKGIEPSYAAAQSMNMKNEVSSREKSTPVETQSLFLPRSRGGKADRVLQLSLWHCRGPHSRTPVSHFITSRIESFCPHLVRCVTLLHMHQKGITGMCNYLSWIDRIVFKYIPGKLEDSHLYFPTDSKSKP